MSEVDTEEVCESCGAPTDVRLPDGSTWCARCNASAVYLGYDDGRHLNSVDVDDAVVLAELTERGRDELVAAIHAAESDCHSELVHIQSLLSEAVHLIDSACGDDEFLSRNAERVADFIRRAS